MVVRDRRRRVCFRAWRPLRRLSSNSLFSWNPLAASETKLLSPPFLLSLKPRPSLIVSDLLLISLPARPPVVPFQPSSFSHPPHPPP